MLFLKISATDPSSALRNAKEIINILIEQYGSKENVPPDLILYPDRGPEYQTTFSCIKMATISLQSFLNLDQILAVRTVPGHSFRKPAEKINCILNLGLYRVGCMQQKCTDIEFEEKLHHCSGIRDVRVLIDRNIEHNTQFVKSAYQPCIDLISDSFSHLKLKEQHFHVYKPCSLEEIDEFFGNIISDPELKSHGTKTELPQQPKLSKYLAHCEQEGTYFISLKSLVHLMATFVYCHN